jgi:hypothetical protein
MSEEKYNIKINPKKPKKEGIRNRMDFNSAYETYTHKVYRTPWNKFQRHSSKNRKTSMFIILMIVVGSLVFIENDDYNKDRKDVSPSKEYDIKHPLDTSSTQNTIEEK